MSSEQPVEQPNDNDEELQSLGQSATAESPDQPLEDLVAPDQLGDSPAAPSDPGSELALEAAPAGLAIGPFAGAAFAVLAVLIGWALLEAFHPVFAVSPEFISDNPSAEQSLALAEAEVQVSLYNSVLVLACAGALLAGLLAVGEGLARRSMTMMIAGFIGCALAGAALGGLAGWVGHSVYQSAKLPGQATIDLAGTMVVQMTMLAALGAGVGLTLGSLAGEAGSLCTRIIAGALAGVLAGLVGPFATANLLPAAQTEQVVPRGDFAALLWLGTTGLLLGLIVPGMKLRRKKS